MTSNKKIPFLTVVRGPQKEVEVPVREESDVRKPQESFSSPHSESNSSSSFVSQSLLGPSVGRILAPESLSLDQVNLLNRLMDGSSTEGVLSGALTGIGVWDLRPLIVRQGAVYIIRTTDPALRPESDGFQQCRLSLRRLEGRGGYTRMGQFGSQLWVERPYYRELLSGAPYSHASSFADLLRGLIQQVERLHNQGVFHGHISISNVVWDNAELGLIDPCLAIFSPSSRSEKEDIAPEIRRGVPGGYPSDIYGLGLIFRHLLQVSGRWTSGEYRGCVRCIESMTHEDPLNRPSLFQISEVIGQISGTTSSMHFTANEPSPPSSSSISVVSEQIPVAGDNRILRWIGNHFLTLFFIAVVLLMVWRLEHRYNQRREEIPFESYWSSNEPPLMKEVASAAVIEANVDAQRVILQSVRSGANPPSVIGSILKVSFDPRWEKELQEKDVISAFRVATSALLPSSEHLTKIPTSLHPGVLLALLGSLDVSSRGSQFVSIPITRMQSLPDPIGKSYTELGKIGVQNLEDESAKSLAHILVGDFSPKIFQRYLVSGEKNGAKDLTKLLILRPLIQADASVATMLYQTILASPSPVAGLLEWFEKDGLNLWKSTNEQERLRISMGEISSGLSVDQKIDLLSFPIREVREASLKNVSSLPSLKDMRELFLAIMKKNEGLSRTQKITLLTVLQAKGEAGYTFVAKWFRTNPDPSTVARLILLRRQSGVVDAFSIEGSRYLSTHAKDLKLTLNEIQSLVTHPEPLARAVGYLLLSPKIPEQRSLLENMVTIEPNERMRKEIQIRLKSG